MLLRKLVSCGVSVVPTFRRNRIHHPRRRFGMFLAVVSYYSGEYHRPTIDLLPPPKVITKPSEELTNKMVLEFKNSLTGSV